MRAVPAVHIHRAVVDHAVAAARADAGKVLQRHHAALRDVRVHVGRRAAAKAGVGHGGDLRAAVIAAGIGRCAADDLAAARLVVRLAQQPVLDPGHVRHLGNRLHLGAVRQHGEGVAVAADDLGAAGGDGSIGQAEVAARLHAHAVERRPAHDQVGGDLKGRLEGGDRHHVGQVLHLLGLPLVHTHLVGEIRQVGHHFGALGLQRRAPFGQDGAAKLHDPVVGLPRRHQEAGRQRQAFAGRGAKAARAQVQAGRRFGRRLGGGRGHGCPRREERRQCQGQRRAGSKKTLDDQVSLLENNLFDWNESAFRRGGFAQRRGASIANY